MVVGILFATSIVGVPRNAAVAVGRPAVQLPASLVVGQRVVAKVDGLLKNDIVTGRVDGVVAFGPQKSTGSHISFEFVPTRVGPLQVSVRISRRGKTLSASGAGVVAVAGSAPTTATAVPAPSTTTVASTIPSGMDPGPSFPFGTWLGIPQLELPKKAVSDYLTPDGNRIVTCGFFGEVLIHDLRYVPRTTFVETLPQPANLVRFGCPLLFTGRANIVGLEARNWPGYNRSIGVIINLDTRTIVEVPDPFQKISADGSTVLLFRNNDWFWHRPPGEYRTAVIGATPEFTAAGYYDIIDMSDSGDSVLFRYGIRGSAVARAYVRNMITGTVLPVGESISGDPNNYNPVKLSGDGSTVLWTSLDALNFVDVKTGRITGTVKGFDQIFRAQIGMSGTKAMVQDRQGLYFVRPSGVRTTIVATGFVPGNFTLSSDFSTLMVPGTARGLPATWHGVYRFPPDHDVRRD